MDKRKTKVKPHEQGGYAALIRDISGVLESAWKASVRCINAFCTNVYWLDGRRIIECDYHRMDRSGYYSDRLSFARDISRKPCKELSKSNLFSMKSFYLAYSEIFQIVSAQFLMVKLSNKFSLSWSYYVRQLEGKSHLNLY